MSNALVGCGGKRSWPIRMYHLRVRLAGMRKLMKGLIAIGIPAQIRTCPLWNTSEALLARYLACYTLDSDRCIPTFRKNLLPVSSG
jgi:hypothetical protein